VVLEDVQSVLMRAFDADSWTDDLREAVDVVGADAAFGLECDRASFAPRLGPKTPTSASEKSIFSSLADSMR